MYEFGKSVLQMLLRFMTMGKFACFKQRLCANEESVSEEKQNLSRSY